MVNTFIPYSDFDECAKVLDNKRLGKQRVEAKQIIDIITGKSKGKGWVNHVVTKMWRGHEKALMLYYNAIVQEWIKRGFKNNMMLFEVKGRVVKPWFITNRSIRLSHQASLIRKYKEYYSHIFKDVPEEYLQYSYIWPSKLTKQQIIFLKQHKKDVVKISDFSKKIA